jgi:hypothetical protein
MDLLNSQIAQEMLKHFKRDVRLTGVQKRVIRAACSGLEVYWRSGNWGGKTTGGALLGVSLSQGKSEIDGVPLPSFEMPAHGWVMMRSYKQGGPSVLAAYRKALADWPHEIGWINKRLEYAGMIWVKPEHWTNDEPESWSKITFASQENTDVALGGRLDWVHADEPPIEETWREIRKAGVKSRGFVAFITATPLKASEWGWLESDFEGCRDQPKNGRLLIVSSVYDNMAGPPAYGALLPEVIHDLEEKYEGDPLKRARLYGDPIDVTTACPFDAGALERWRRRCVPGIKEAIFVQSKIDNPIGRQRAEIILEVEKWGEADPDDTYYITADLASGVDSPIHDPLCLHVWARRARSLRLVYNGYVNPYGLGWLAGLLSVRFNSPLGPALHDPENNSGYIDQYLEGLSDCLATKNLPLNISRQQYKHKPGTWAPKLGYHQDQRTRHSLINAWMRALIDDDCDIRSVQVVDCLAHCEIDAKGNVAARHGYHDEHLICGGRALDVLNTKGAIKPPKTAPSDSIQRFHDMLTGALGNLPKSQRGNGDGLRWSS